MEIQYPAIVNETIPDKATMRALYEQGVFGNRFRTFTLADALAGMAPLPVGLMYNGRPGARLPRYAEPLATVAELEETCAAWLARGRDRRRITVSQSDKAANTGRLLQGEVMRDEHYLSLMYTTIDDLMRAALARETRHAAGLQAKLLLQQAMDAASWDTLQDIWTRYPTAVVEFSIFNRGVGTLGHNTVFWEVRNY